MNFNGRFFLLTCVFAITLQVTFAAEKGASFGNPCNTSEQCLSRHNNTECDSVKKRCFCAQGYGAEDIPTFRACEKYPFRKVDSTRLETEAHLDCKIVISDLSELLWHHNGIDICTTNPTWCSKNTTYNETSYSYSRNLTLPSVTTNGTYNCLAITNDGGKWTVSETELIVGVKFGESCNTSEECLAVTNNSECDRDNKRCFCAPSYGLDYEDRKIRCNKYPFRKVEYSKFDTSIDLQCEIVNSNTSVIVWLRNGTLCTPGSVWCSPDKKSTYNEQRFSFSKNMSVRHSFRNDTYTCQAITNDGSNWTVSETRVVVFSDPLDSPPIYSAIDSDNVIYCGVETPNLEVRLVRDGKDTCTRTASWCSPSKAEINLKGSSRLFNVLKLRANHTFTCEAYDGNVKLATVSVKQIIVGLTPKILRLTVSRPSPQPKGTRFVATALFNNPVEESRRSWKITKWPPLDLVLKDIKDEQMKVLNHNQYETSVSLGPIYNSSYVSLQVSNIYGTDLTSINVYVAMKYGEICYSTKECATTNSECLRQCVCRFGYIWDSTICRKSVDVKHGERCNSTALCTTTKNTECDKKSEQCSCSSGYYWDSFICRKNGAKGMFAMQKEGILMLILAILLNLGRSATFTDC